MSTIDRSLGLRTAPSAPSAQSAPTPQPARPDKQEPLKRAAAVPADVNAGWLARLDLPGRLVDVLLARHPVQPSDFRQRMELLAKRIAEAPPLLPEMVKLKPGPYGVENVVWHQGEMMRVQLSSELHRGAVADITFIRPASLVAVGVAYANPAGAVPRTHEAALDVLDEASLQELTRAVTAWLATDDAKVAAGARGHRYRADVEDTILPRLEQALSQRSSAGPAQPIAAALVTGRPSAGVPADAKAAIAAATGGPTFAKVEPDFLAGLVKRFIR